MLKKNSYAIVFFTWMAIITYLSLTTITNDNDSWSLNIPHLDKAVHFTFYFGAAFLGFLFLRALFEQKMKMTSILTISLLFAIVYGIGIEFLQYRFFPDRSGDLYDALANSIGAFSAIVVVKVFFLTKRGLK